MNNKLFDSNDEEQINKKNIYDSGNALVGDSVGGESDELYDEELETLARLYIGINNEEFSYISKEDIKKLKAITGEVCYDIEKTLSFLKERHVLMDAAREKDKFLNIFDFRKKEWENSILRKMAQKLSIPKEEEKEFISYIKDYFLEDLSDREEITEIVKNKKYLNYSSKAKTKIKNTKHYVWLVLSEVITVMVVLLIYGALAEYGAFENIAMSILFLIYYNIADSRLKMGLVKIIEAKEVYKNIKTFKLLLNDMPNKEDKENIREIDIEQEKYLLDMAIIGFFDFILYCIVLYNLFTQLF